MVKKSWFSVRTVLVILTAILVGYVVYVNWFEVIETIDYLKNTNVLVLLLLIPEQLIMYYACGQIFFSYLSSRKTVRKITQKEVLQISTELNFVSHAIPAGGIGGLAFLTYRLRPLNVPAGQTSFLYVFRYAITTVINYFQALVAIVVLLVFSLIPNEAMWIIPVAIIMNVGVIFMLWLVIHIAGSKERINLFGKFIDRFGGQLAKMITFGHKKRLVDPKKITKYFMDIYQNVNVAKKNRRFLKKPILWGLVFSCLEILTYWIVAIALGRPELLPYIMIGEAIGSALDGIVPYGLYELGMAGVMIALGVDFPTATIVTVVTRGIMLIFTIFSGSIPYYKAIKGKMYVGTT